ncbi:hypothetical protein FPE01S_05_01710 [Flavihumibacter petaseus NBRC 106054]|uniref:DUF2911 domain-containing protein n=1 Tax=Flavihumibacter petaseus NBRC 106054 TaxID=1220578 RepID=A0A0E9N704_9BACT|nr:hypothetical protein FPE01S_05_01710 [Flavihumibacter petaseus NBRC 106054]
MEASAQATEVCYNPNLVKDTSKKSINAMAVGVVSGDSIRIAYHSPAVRKRVIWGGLVPYDEVWVTGAHDATTIEIGKTMIIAGKELAPGKYALFTIPGKKEWMVIINRHWQQHLASEYDQKDDAVRLKVRPKKNGHTERLQYFITGTTRNAGKIAMAWEQIIIEFPFSINN